MHVDGVEIDDSLVRRLLVDQFPEWADLPLKRVEPAGTVNAIFRLGDRLALRLPRRKGPTKPGGKELDWLPKLAPLLPLEIPVPVAQGQPGAEYPWFWDVHTWVDGETATVNEIDAIQAAHDLAAFISALRQVDPTEAPPGRGVPLSERDHEFRHWLARFDGDRRVRSEWERALAAPAWDGPPVWHHGDLDVRNWLVRNGRISGVIDWGSMGAGDPACDVMVAWKLHAAVGRDAFRAALRVDDATWDRARGWVVSQAVAALAYYTPENNPSLYNEAQSWLELVLSE
jgi:aminoglycoside phosphotransferase (APT) family kinase protein